MDATHNKSVSNKMDNIEKAQYKNLRKCFQENLVTPILGKSYYNMGMDVYDCDEETTLSLKWKFDNQKHDIKIYRNLFIISMVINIISVLFRLL